MITVYQIHTRYADGEGYADTTSLPLRLSLEAAIAAAQKFANDDFDDLDALDDDGAESLPALEWTLLTPAYAGAARVWVAEFADVVYTITECEVTE